MLSLDPFEPDDAKRYDLKEYTMGCTHKGRVVIMHRPCRAGGFIENMDEATAFMMDHDCTEE